jgi:hypothetical protein
MVDAFAACDRERSRESSSAFTVQPAASVFFPVNW